MTATTPRGAFPYPVGGDNSKQVRVHIQGLADQVAAVAALFVQGTAATRPPVGVSGRFHSATDTGALSYDTGSVWLPIRSGTATVRVPHTFTISGALDTSTLIPGFFLDLPAGQTVKLRHARVLLGAGTATVLVKRNGTTAITASVTTTAADTADPNLTLTDNDYFTIAPSVVSSATALSVSLYLDYTV